MPCATETGGLGFILDGTYLYCGVVKIGPFYYNSLDT